MLPKKPPFGDPLVLFVVGLLFCIGVFVLYTTVPLNAEKGSWLDSLVARQMIFGAISFLIMFAIARVDLQITKTLIIQGLGLGSVILLLAGLFILGPIVNETHRWYKVGQFLFQPSEFAKIALALWAAYWVTQDKVKGSVRVVAGGFGVALTLGLVLLQPDFGATVILSLISLTIICLWVSKFELGRISLMFLAATFAITLLALYSTPWLLVFEIVPVLLLVRTNWRVGFVGAALAGVVVLIVIFGAQLWQTSIVPSYVKNRVESFLGAQEESFQVQQSKIAIGSGQLWGKGISQGTQSRLRFLPEYTTDFIYSAFVEERGFAGMLLLFALYLLLFGRLIFLAFKVQDEYSRLIIIGLTVKLWFETFLNIGMNMGALPTKGVALPFMSYGGSSLLANSIIIGIILSLYRYEAKHDTISPSFGLA